MPLKRETPEQRAEKAADKARKQLQTEQRKEVERRERERQAFLATPPGQARLAFERADHVFQYSLDRTSRQRSG